MNGLLLLASIGIQGPSLEGNVTFACRAEPLSQLVPALGQACGLKLAVNTDLAKDVMIVSVEGKPIRELLTRIATADAAQWRPADGGLILTADNRARRVEAAEELGHRSVRFADYVSRLSKPTTAPVDTEKEDSDSEANLPETIAVVKLIRQLTFSELPWEIGGRVVYSTNPNGMQRPLGAGADSTIQSIIDAHNKSLVHAGADQSGGGNPNGLSVGQAPVVEKISGYAKADLSIYRNSPASDLYAELKVFGDKGQTLLTADADISLDSETALPVVPAAKPREETIQTSDATKAFSQMFSGRRRGIPPALNEVTAPFVLDPEHHDPLSMYASDELLAVASNLGLPLVAVVPDSAMSIVNVMTGRAPTIQDILSDLKDGGDMRRLNDDGWLTVKPVYPEEARETRIDRTALGALMRAVHAKDIPGLTDIAAFAEKNPSPVASLMSAIFVNILAPGALTKGADPGACWHLLRIYSQLPPTVQRDLADGREQTERLSTFSSSQFEEVNGLVFGPSPTFEVTKVAAPSSTGEDLQPESDYTDEPTEVLTSGIPASGMLKITVKQDRFFAPVIAGQKEGAVLRLMSVQDVARAKWIQSDPRFSDVAARMPRYIGYRIGSRSVYTFHFDYGNGVSSSSTLNDNLLPKNSPMIPVDELPDDLKAQIAAAIQQFKDMSGSGAPGFGDPPQQP
jgi:hypothetical protein